MNDIVQLLAEFGVVLSCGWIDRTAACNSLSNLIFILRSRGSVSFAGEGSLDVRSNEQKAGAVCKRLFVGVHLEEEEKNE